MIRGVVGVRQATDAPLGSCWLALPAPIALLPPVNPRPDGIPPRTPTPPAATTRGNQPTLSTPAYQLTCIRNPSRRIATSLPTPCVSVSQTPCSFLERVLALGTVRVEVGYHQPQRLPTCLNSVVTLAGAAATMLHAA